MIIDNTQCLTLCPARLQSTLHLLVYLIGAP